GLSHLSVLPTDASTSDIFTLSLHDALPILGLCRLSDTSFACDNSLEGMFGETVRSMLEDREGNLWIGTTSSGLHRLSQSKLVTIDRKSTRLNSSHVKISYAGFCLKKKKTRV